jgi:hypothetical protein
MLVWIKHHCHVKKLSHVPRPHLRMSKDKRQARTRPAKLPIAILQIGGEKKYIWHNNEVSFCIGCPLSYAPAQRKEDRGENKERARENILNVRKEKLVRQILSSAQKEKKGCFTKTVRMKFW